MTESRQPMEKPLGVILAGGRSRRMGGAHKAAVVLGGRTLLERAADRLGPQCGELVVNANGGTGGPTGTGLPIVPDDLPDRPGPLAGIVAALDWAAAERPGVRQVVSVAVDTPFLPRDLVERLSRACREAGAPVACAASGGRRHPVAALWSVPLRGELRRLLVEDGMRRLHAVLDRLGAVDAAWPDPTWPDPPCPALPWPDTAGPDMARTGSAWLDAAFDPFFNVNTPDDLAAAAAILAAHPAA